MKSKITPKEIQRIYELSQQGMGDKEIGKLLHVGTNAVAEALVRVAPDGRIMECRYGYRSNDPSYRRPTNPLGMTDEVPVLEFLAGRKHA